MHELQNANPRHPRLCWRQSGTKPQRHLACSTSHPPHEAMHPCRLINGRPSTKFPQLACLTAQLHRSHIHGRVARDTVDPITSANLIPTPATAPSAQCIPIRSVHNLPLASRFNPIRGQNHARALRSHAPCQRLRSGAPQADKGVFEVELWLPARLLGRSQLDSPDC